MSEAYVSGKGGYVKHAGPGAQGVVDVENEQEATEGAQENEAGAESEEGSTNQESAQLGADKVEETKEEAQMETTADKEEATAAADLEEHQNLNSDDDTEMTQQQP